MKLAPFVLLAAALAYAAAVVAQPVAVYDFSGAISYTYTCGADVDKDYGYCNGDCVGVIGAVDDSTADRAVRVLVGGREAPVKMYIYKTDDVYKPNVYLAVFEAKWPGKVEVRTGLRVEAYILVSRQGGGEMRVGRLYVLPYVANRTAAGNYTFKLDYPGEVVACTMGKRAREAEVLQRDRWVKAEVKTGWYSGLVRGDGSAIRFHWDKSITESAVKLYYIFATARVPPNKSYVVGLDGRPVPSWVLNLIVSDAAGLEDGVVYHYGEARLRTPRGEVALRPGQRYVVEGRHCVVTGYATNGAPLDLEIYYGNYKAAAGRGSVATYCLEGAYRVRYRYYNATAVAKVDYSGEASGNVTLKLVPVTVRVVGLFSRPLYEAVVYAPPGYRVELNLSKAAPGLSTYATAGHDRHVELEIIKPWGFTGVITLAVVAVIAVAVLIRDRMPTLFDALISRSLELYLVLTLPLIFAAVVGPYMSRALDLIDAFGIYVLATVPLAVATTYAIHDRRKIPSMALYLAATYAALILIINYEGTIYSWLLLFSLWLAAAVTSITHYTTIHIKTCRIRCHIFSVSILL
ncbi:hypothetical protein P186_1019 [Pyrobaculum ferrireducens]|uniref:Uncharacterized protein n=1 Tax=Pyrobaculum ferrireducens TaxID=1104324 RepID=G7VBV6_9CREN|nr:hypothetical protein P186_1019 [Pyrobaculum ferrireducens]